MTMHLPYLLAFLSFLLSSLTVQAQTLASAAPPTNLSLPLPQNLTSPCCTNSQTFYGPTVDSAGRGLYYAGENKTLGQADPEKGGAVWGEPGIQLADGTRCCESLNDIREYIDYIDSALIAYLALRQQFVAEATRFKASAEGVRAQDRAVAVVKQAQTLAKGQGLAEWVANVSYTATLNSFVELELCLLNEYAAADTTADNS